jgi:hypothetical protein
MCSFQLQEVEVFKITGIESWTATVGEQSLALQSVTLFNERITKNKDKGVRKDIGVKEKELPSNCSPTIPRLFQSVRHF